MIRCAIVLAMLSPLTGVESAVSRDAVLEQMSKSHVLALRNGANDVDLDGDGQVDLVFVARRLNGNAHSYDRLTFYRRGAASEANWQLVPFLDARETAEEDSLRTLEGADCDLRSVVVLGVKQDGPVSVVVGERELGESFAESAKVHFLVYTLTRNEDGIPGWPLVYFKLTATIDGKSKHCDIHEAFASELGVR